MHEVRFELKMFFFKSPGGMVVKQAKNQDLVETFYFDMDKLNIIIVKGVFEGFPEIIMIEFQDERICEGDEIPVNIMSDMTSE